MCNILHKSFQWYFLWIISWCLVLTETQKPWFQFFFGKNGKEWPVLLILIFFFPPPWTKQMFFCFFLGELFLFNSRSKENQKHFFSLYILSYALLIQMTVSTVRMINKSYWYSMWYKVKQINHAVWLYLFFCDISGRKRLESEIHAKLSAVTVPSL